MKCIYKNYKKDIRMLIRILYINISVIISIVVGILTVSFYLSRKLFNLIKINIKFRNLSYSHIKIKQLIKEMNPRQFEVFCCEIFKQLGYKAKLTPRTCDGGKDIIIKKEGFKTYVECKKWKIGNNIGREVLQKLVGASVGDNAYKSIIITTSGYNDNALEYAQKIENLELWNTNNLINLISSLNDNNIKKIMCNTFKEESGDFYIRLRKTNKKFFKSLNMSKIKYNG